MMNIAQHDVAGPTLRPAGRSPAGPGRREGPPSQLTPSQLSRGTHSYADRSAQSAPPAFLLPAPTRDCIYKPY